MPGDLVSTLSARYALNDRQRKALGVLCGELSSDGSAQTRSVMVWAVSLRGHRDFIHRLIKEREKSLPCHPA